MGKVVRLRKDGDEYEDYQKRRKTIIVRWAGGHMPRKSVDRYVCKPSGQALVLLLNLTEGVELEFTRTQLLEQVHGGCDGFSQRCQRNEESKTDWTHAKWKEASGC